MQNILKCKRLTKLPVLIVANKQDMHNSMSTDQIIERLNLNQLLTIPRKRDWSIKPCVCVNVVNCLHVQKRNVKTIAVLENLNWILSTLNKDTINYDYSTVIDVMC